MKDDPSRTVVSGPLALFAGGSLWSCPLGGIRPGRRMQQMCLMAHLSRWLEAEGLGAAALSPMVVKRFLAARRAAGYSHLLSVRALDSLLAYLRGLDACRRRARRCRTGRWRSFCAAFGGIWRSSAAWCLDLRAGYVHRVRPFVEEFVVDGRLELAGVDAAAVRRFVVTFCTGRARRTTEVLVAAMRALLRFLYFDGELPRLLVDAVPSVAVWRLADVPRRLEAIRYAGFWARVTAGHAARAARFRDRDRARSPGVASGRGRRAGVGGHRLASGGAHRGREGRRARNGCRCRSMSARRSSRICVTATAPHGGRGGVRADACATSGVEPERDLGGRREDSRTGRARDGARASFAAHRRVGDAARGRGCRRSARCSVTGRRPPPRSTRRSTATALRQVARPWPGRSA